MKSLEELDKLREQLQKEMQIREGEQEVKVVVTMGTCGIAAGAREVITALLEEINKRGLKGVTVAQTGCAGLCHYEPLVEVERPGRDKVTYVHVDSQKAREIVLEHLVHGQIIKEWTILSK
ncbi:MAG: (2Fe-2S) ferredoxin domain-containing protein [Thermoanaerobacteraceae bacterium]|uniref:(2Fe-2S) ferredoxin domain-containing protein n=1 Tax=Desulfofundulus thermobenzoicus TaxID=29376 RepID=A0A6N7IM08_9FIRM|nr:(2Fe-2S) ferredoxin domain-containing protein [Desulfofundulus thermobenzoicus]MBE3589108.1 (2Fe-2S) ferredoxin domain-containing protein [Thermoanaerobacteraceae bacterium]MQL50981.1 (2Fe-2S) ferredoxin domain-containing protein [Desulfofundulus thermobenzoicus]HHW43482.1 (2Fe-2S) ferredoxin domain-containing protein [Desulfotomaculum sp.]